MVWSGMPGNRAVCAVECSRVAQYSFYDVVEQRYIADESERVACQGQRHEKQVLRLLAAAFPSHAWKASTSQMVKLMD